MLNRLGADVERLTSSLAQQQRLGLEAGKAAAAGRAAGADLKQQLGASVISAGRSSEVGHGRCCPPRHRHAP